MAVTEGEDEVARKLVIEALEAGVKPLDILNKGVVAGIQKTGELCRNNEYFLPDVIMSADAFKAGMAPLEPRLKKGDKGRHGSNFVIGVVEGDMHDLGKSLVIAMLTSAGFNVIDLGIDVKPEKFLEAAKENTPELIGLSALLTTTMVNMKEVIDLLKLNGINSKIIVGGAPLTDNFAKEINADGYAHDAATAVETGRALLN